jgi:hypothetical protein
MLPLHNMNLKYALPITTHAVVKVEVVGEVVTLDVKRR